MPRAVLIGPTYPYRGGISHYTTLLFDAMQRENVDTILISFSRQYPRCLFPGTSDRDSSETPVRVEDANYWLDSLNPFTWLVVFIRLRQFRPTNLILQWWTGYWGPVWLTLLHLNNWFLRCPVTFVCHNVVPHDAGSGARWLTKQVLRHAHRCIVHTETERSRLNELLPNTPVSVVPMPPFDLFGKYRTQTAVARMQLQIPSGVPVILFFGIVRPYKGLEDLLLAMPAILAKSPNALLVIAGEFWSDRAGYINLISELGIGDNVVIDDRYIPDEEVGLYFSAADLVVFPYRRASGSAALRSANTFGLPVVATEAVRTDDSDGARRVYWTPAGNPEGLATAVSAQIQKSRDNGIGNCGACIEDVDQGWAELARHVMETT